MRRLAALAALAALTGGAPAAAQETPIAFTGARLHTVSAGVIDPGVLVVHRGRIAAVGSTGGVEIPPEAELRDVSGRVIVPGLVDTHSHIGVYPRPLVPANRDANENSDPVTPMVRAIDSIWPADPAIRMAVAGGITTANIMPGSGNAVGGQTAYVKLRGRTVEEMLIKGPDGRPVIGGMKMANGENPKRAHQKAPETRMAIAQLQRQLFVKAQAYRDKKDRERDLGLEAMLEVLDGRRVVHHHTHRADDILTVLRIAEEFGHRVVIQHGTEAFRVAAELAEKGIPVSAIVVDSPGGKHEAIDLRLDNPGLLERAGVEVAIHTDDFITDSRLFLRSGALAVRGGMSEPGALRALTLAGAEMLDLGQRIGSLERGKDADFVLLSGPPFATRTRVLETWIEGERVFELADPRDRRYQTGGFGVAERYPGPASVTP